MTNQLRQFKPGGRQIHLSDTLSATTQYVILPLSLKKSLCVSLSDVIYLEGFGNYTMFYLTEGRQVLVAKTIKEYYPILEADVFVRTHRSFVVNLRHTEHLDMRDMFVQLRGGLKIAISRRKKKSFRQRTEALLQHWAAVS
jgi:DNA-binding LytR/AlgR family response regulator